MSEIKYHSAMKKYGGIAKSNKIFNNTVYGNDKIKVLQHDICSKDIPDIFYSADAVYSVMAWRAGYNHFIENTIAEQSTFKEYCEGISRTIKILNKPSFIITNKTFCKNLEADKYCDIKFDRFNSDDICAIWNYDIDDIPSTTIELMKKVGNQYNVVLDFCCGYGEISYYVKKCILSDINTGCIDYIKEALIYG